mmetsp:Transcript_49608/g.114578  ORF Transcript_49608/g.114578 Transcript_49608/m.114578 type:complete len:243 (-) Transcript_49608:1338-2066(-)
MCVGLEAICIRNCGARSAGGICTGGRRLALQIACGGERCRLGGAGGGPRDERELECGDLCLFDAECVLVGAAAGVVGGAALGVVLATLSRATWLSAESGGSAHGRGAAQASDSATGSSEDPCEEVASVTGAAPGRRVGGSLDGEGATATSVTTTRIAAPVGCGDTFGCDGCGESSTLGSKPPVKRSPVMKGWSSACAAVHRRKGESRSSPWQKSSSARRRSRSAVSASGVGAALCFGWLSIS